MENDGYESKSEVERIVNELRDVTINVENYKKYIDKIRNTERVILAQLENFIRTYKEMKIKFEEKSNTQNFRDAETQGFVPKEIYDLQSDMNIILRDSYSWKSLAAEMNKLFFEKISSVLEDIKALDIKRDAIVEFREMSKQQSSLFLNVMQSQNNIIEEMVNHKLAFIDEKIFNTVKLMQQENNNEKKALLNTFAELMKGLNFDKSRVANAFDEQLEKDAGKIEVLGKKIQAPIKPIDNKPTLPSHEEMQEKPDSGNPFDEEEDGDDDIDIDVDDEDDKK